MSELADELSMAQKLELLRTALPKGSSRGYEPAGEKSSPVVASPKFERCRIETTEVAGSRADLDEEPEEPLVQSSAGESLVVQGKVSAAGLNESDVPIWSLFTITVRDHGVEFVVPDTILEGETGFIVLEVERNPTSRVVVAVEPQIVGSVPESDSTFQYIVIAEVGGEISPVVQHHLGELDISEELVVESGELMYQSYRVLHRNSYAIP